MSSSEPVQRVLHSSSVPRGVVSRHELFVLGDVNYCKRLLRGQWVQPGSVARGGQDQSTLTVPSGYEAEPSVYQVPASPTSDPAPESPSRKKVVVAGH